MSKHKTNSNWTSFSLLNLMALATIVAVWLPWWLARKDPKRLQTEIDLMNQSLGRLVVNDPADFVAVQLAKFSYDLDTWRFHVPDDMKLEACLAVEGISDAGLPEEFERLNLPKGKHELSLLVKNHREHGFRFEVYLDGDLHIKIERPAEWLDTGGSSSNNHIGTLSEVYDLSEPCTIKKLVFDPVLYKNTSNSLYLTQDSMASVKGCYLWLQPVGHVSKPILDWIDETTSGYPKQLGLREGVRLRHNNDFRPGLQIHHPESMTHHLPVAKVFMEFESDEADLSLSTRNAKTGKWKFSAKPNKFVPPSFQSKTQRQQNLYLIHELNKQDFPGARPPQAVVEILFDQDYPDDIGFRLVPPENGIPVERWKIRVVHHSGQYWKTMMTKDGIWNSEDGPGTIDLSALPQIQYKDLFHRAIEIRSPAEDLSEWKKLKVPRNQRFEAVPQRQTWLVPHNAATGDSPMTLSLKVSGVDEKSAPLSGGPVITEMILDVENPGDSIHWYRIDVQPFDD